MVIIGEWGREMKSENIKGATDRFIQMNGLNRVATTIYQFSFLIRTEAYSSIDLTSQPIVANIGVVC